VKECLRPGIQPYRLKRSQNSEIEIQSDVAKFMNIQAATVCKLLKKHKTLVEQKNTKRSSKIMFSRQNLKINLKYLKV